MADNTLDFDQALAQASAHGYAEADPALDIDGWDAAHKAVIMSWLAFGTPLQMNNIHVRGVRGFDLADLKHAARFNYAIKLIATICAHADGIQVSVLPALVADDTNLATVGDNLNAILVNSDASGELVLIGAGAGAAPTASAVVSDIVQAAREMISDSPNLIATEAKSEVLTFEKVKCESYMRVQAIDSKGIVAKLSGLLAQANISIEAIHQDESVSGQPTNLIFLLHEANWGSIDACAKQIAKFNEITTPPVVMPIAIPHPKQ